MFKRIISQLPQPTFIGSITFTGYLLLLISNVNNKIIALVFFALAGLYWLTTKSVYFSLILAWFASSIIHSGKVFTFELIPPGVYSTEIFPQGIVQHIFITPNLIIGCLTLLIAIRLWLKNQSTIQLSSAEKLFFAFYTWTILADAFGSKNPFLSLTLSLQSVSLIGLLLLIKQVKINTSFIKSLAAIAVASMMFELILVGMQSYNKAPLYKNLESQVTLEYFGRTADEKDLPFRPVGTFKHANNLALWVGVHVVFLAGLAALSKSPQLNMLLLVQSAVLISTMSRSSWIAAFASVSLLVWFFTKKYHLEPYIYLRKKLPLLLTVLIPLLIVYVLPRVARSSYTFIEGGGVLRKFQIAETVLYILNNPIFGSGSGQGLLALREANPYGVFAKVGLGTHNWFLYSAAEHGILSVIIWMWAIFLQIANYFKKCRTQKLTFHNTLRLTTIASIVFVSIVALFQPFIGDNIVVPAIFIINNYLATDSHEKNKARSV